MREQLHSVTNTIGLNKIKQPNLGISIIRQEQINTSFTYNPLYITSTQFRLNLSEITERVNSTILALNRANTEVESHEKSNISKR